MFFPLAKVTFLAIGLAVVLMVGNEIVGISQAPTPTPTAPAIMNPTPNTLEATVPEPTVAAAQHVAEKAPSTEPCNFESSGIVQVPIGQCEKMTDCELEDGSFKSVFESDCNALHNRMVRDIEVARQTDQVKNETNTPTFSQSTYVSNLEDTTITNERMTCRYYDALSDSWEALEMTRSDCTKYINRMTEQNDQYLVQRQLQIDAAARSATVSVSSVIPQPPKPSQSTRTFWCAGKPLLPGQKCTNSNLNMGPMP